MADKRANVIYTVTDKATSAFKRIGNSAKNLFSRLVSLRGILGAAGLGAAITKVNNLFIEQQRVMAQTEAVIKSTGGAANLTAQEINEMAGELQNLTNFGDEAIQNGQNLLLTFTQIGRDVFPRATETMLDMSQAMNQGIKESAIQLGKALNDPIMGITALRRVGIQFNESQEETIRLMVESGRVMDAQGVILDELSRQFGGSARAAVNPFTQLKNAIGDLGEAIGGALQPLLVPLASSLLTVVQTTTRWVEGIGNLAIPLQNAIIFLKSLSLNAQITFQTLTFQAQTAALRIKSAFTRNRSELEQREAAFSQRIQELRDEQVALEIEAQDILLEKDTETTNAKIDNNALLRDLQMQTQKEVADNEADLVSQNLRMNEKAAKERERILEQERIKTQDVYNALGSGFAAMSNNNVSVAQATAQSVLRVAVKAALSDVKARALAEAAKASLQAPLSFGATLLALAPIAAAEAAANAAINSIRLADGGIVRASNGGTLATIGEAGQDEAVIPLDSREARQRLGGERIERIVLDVGGMSVLAKAIYKTNNQQIRTGELSERV